MKYKDPYCDEANKQTFIWVLNHLILNIKIQINIFKETLLPAFISLLFAVFRPMIRIKVKIICSSAGSTLIYVVLNSLIIYYLDFCHLLKVSNIRSFLLYFLLLCYLFSSVKKSNFFDLNYFRIKGFLR